MSALTWAQVDYAPTRGELDREAFEAGDWPGAQTCRRCSRVIYEAEDGWMDTGTEIGDEFVCDDGDPHDPTNPLQGPAMTDVLLGLVADHTDVDCPPDPHAICRHCGNELGHHQPADPDGIPVPGEAVCYDDAAAAWLAGRAPQRFKLADGESLDCPNTGRDPVCDTLLCSDHSSEFVTCAESSATLHHTDCMARCDACVRGCGPDRAGDH